MTVVGKRGKTPHERTNERNSSAGSCDGSYVCVCVCGSLRRKGKGFSNKSESLVISQEEAPYAIRPISSIHPERFILCELFSFSHGDIEPGLGSVFSLL